MKITVVTIPLRTRFRGLMEREVALIQGADGRLGRVEPVCRVRTAEARGLAAMCRGGGSRRLAGAVRDSIPVNVTVPAVGPEQAHAIVWPVVARPPRSRSPSRVRPWPRTRRGLEAVRDALGPAGRIRVDANGRGTSTRPSARSACSTGPRAGLEYVEQPCASVEDLAAVRRRVDVPIAADESIRRAADPYRVRDLEAADIAVLKVQPLGGVRACLRIAEDIGLPVVVSSALESSVGIAAGVALAAALPELPLCLRPGDGSDVHRRRGRRSMLPVAGMLSVRDSRAWMSRPCERLAAGDARIAWWQDRLSAVLAVRQDRDL